jgi:hypothetical protein
LGRIADASESGWGVAENVEELGQSGSLHNTQGKRQVRLAKQAVIN